MEDLIIVRDLQEFDALLPEWNRFLQEDATDHNIFQVPALIRQEIESGEVGDLLIMGVRRDGRLSCVAPFYVVDEKYSLNLGVLRLATFRARVLRIFGDQLITSREGDVEQDLDRVFSELNALNRKFDLIAISSVPCSGPIWTYFEGELHSRAGFQLRRITFKGAIVRQLRLHGSFDDYLKSMSRKTRYSLKRGVKKFMEATNGTAEFLKITAPGQVADFLENIDRIYANSWQAKTFGYEKRHTPQVEAKLLEAARNGWLRSYLLLSEGGPVAFVLGFQYKDIYYYHDIAFDGDWRAHSPGNVLNMHLIEDLFCCEMPAVLDFGFGENEYKRILGNHSFEATDVYILKSGVNYGSMLVRSQHLLSRGYTGIHSLVTRLGVAGWLRRLLKHR